MILLFDNDGTLVDSELICCKAIAEKYREEHNIHMDVQDLLQRFRGWELAKMLDFIESKYGAPWDQAFVQRYRQHMNSLFEQELQAIEGIPAVLQTLPNTKAVVSNGPLNKIKLSLRVTGLDSHFGKNLFSAYDINIWKPDPEIFIHAAKKMGAPPADCIVIEDSMVGVRGAVNAGMQTLFYNKYRDECEFPEVVQFDSMLDLPTLINRIEG